MVPSQKDTGQSRGLGAKHLAAVKQTKQRQKGPP